MEQLEQKRAERTREALDTMQAWRAERAKSKAQRDALFEEEERLRHQRRNELLEREKQIRDSMYAAAEEAKSKALESGCTEEEAFVEAAAAASRAADVIDDGNSSLFNSSTVDSDDDSYRDDNTNEEDEVLPATLFKNTDTFEGSPVTEPIDDEEEKPPTPTAGPSAGVLDQHDDDDDEEEDAVDCCSPMSKDSSSNEDNLSSTPTDTNPSSDEQQNIDSYLIDTNEAKLLRGRDSSPLSDSISMTEVAHLPTEMKQHTLTEKDHNSYGSHLSVLELPHEAVQVSENVATSTTTVCETEECPGESGPRHDEDCFPLTGKKGRQLCDLYPTFSSIFTNFLTKAKGKSYIDDSTQKELISCMQHQISLHELCPSHALQSDDDSLESNIESCRFYRVNSHRPEVRALLDEVFSHYSLSEWKELPDHINVSSWNLLWTWGQPKSSDFDNLLVFQKINRFRHTKGLARKDLLKKNMQRFGCGHLMPLTYALPHEYNAFVAGFSSIEKAREESSPNFWIVKPIGLSRG